MTLMPKNPSIDEFDNMPGDFTPDRMAGYLAAYVANPLYRSARFEELVIDDNPYRRPVRPEDLSFLRFDEPFSRENSSQLSSLIGHRILLNIYDTSRSMMPHVMTAERWRDFHLFYGERNRVLGELVRPFLEQHVFGYVHRAVDELAERGGSRAMDAGLGTTGLGITGLGVTGLDGVDLDAVVAALRAELTDVADRRRRQAEDIIGIVKGSAAPAEAAKMVAVQLLGSTLNAPLQVSPAMVRRSLGAVPDARAVRPASDAIDGVLEELIRVCGFGAQPHQYYQFYLPSTLALMNYLNATSRGPAGMFRFLGAMSARTLDSSAMVGDQGRPLTALAGSDGSAGLRGLTSSAGLMGSVGPDAANWPAAADQPAEMIVQAVTDMVISPLARRFGPESLREFWRGVREYALLLDVHHDDLATQLTWLDSAEECRLKAERLQHAIDRYRIPVELDTFVESWEECSTTHVHDEDRLLIIESGEMEFWNCFSGTHKFRAGDKMFIPKHRLHGSVVLTGECVYHQPVITPELNERHG